MIQAESILLVVLVFVAIIAMRVENLATQVEERTELVDRRLDDVLKGRAFAKVEPLDNLDMSYMAKNRALEKTKKEVRIYRFREETGSDLKSYSVQAGLWYDRIESWVASDPGRAVYTVVGTPTPQMEEWFHQECAESVGQGNRLLKQLNEELRAPRMNFVVFDRREVIFAAHTSAGPVGVTSAYRVEDEGFASFYADFHAELVRGGDPCPN